jgi:peptidylprolyl isomerase
MKINVWVLAGVVALGCSGEPQGEDGTGKPAVSVQLEAEQGERSSGYVLSAEGPQTIADEDYAISPSGLMHHNFVVGEGAQPTKGQRIRVFYAGWRTDGKLFDSNMPGGRGYITAIGVGRVIRGWDEGMMSMRVGGKRQLVIPPHMAYGDAGAGGVIPPGATLIFEVELVEILP